MYFISRNIPEKVFCIMNFSTETALTVRNAYKGFSVVSLTFTINFFPRTYFLSAPFHNKKTMHHINPFLSENVLYFQCISAGNTLRRTKGVDFELHKCIARNRSILTGFHSCVSFELFLVHLASLKDRNRLIADGCYTENPFSA